MHDESVAFDREQMNNINTNINKNFTDSLTGIRVIIIY